ncbi:MAG: sulfite exporter TauE/SafE family protein [Acidobacteriota bacterium]
MSAFLTPLEIILAIGIACLGTLLQGSIGFGLGLIGVPLLVLINPDFIPGPLLLAAFILNILMSTRELHSIDIKGVGWAVPGRFMGAVVGAFILKLLPSEHLSLLFGLMVLIAVVLTSSGLSLSSKPTNIFGAATFSGIMGTTSAIGGAPMAIVYQHEKGPRIRGTLAAIFLFGTLLSLISLTLIGRFGSKELLMTLILLPGIFLGFFLSKKTAGFLDKGHIRLAVLIASAFSGLLIIILQII